MLPLNAWALALLSALSGPESESPRYIRLLWRLGQADAVVIGRFVEDEAKNVFLKTEKLLAGRLRKGVPVDVSRVACLPGQAGEIVLERRALVLLELQRFDGRPMYVVDDRHGFIPLDDVRAFRAGLHEFPFRKTTVDPLPEKDFLAIVERHLATLRDDAALEAALKKELEYAKEDSLFALPELAMEALGRRRTPEALRILARHLDVHEAAARGMARFGTREAFELLRPHVARTGDLPPMSAGLDRDYAAARAFLEALRESAVEGLRAEITEALKHLALCERWDRELPAEGDARILR